MKYVFRLTKEVKRKMDAVAPPKAHKRSPFVREAITNFLALKKQTLVDRPHLRGREKTYEEICVILKQDQIDGIKASYPEVSASVVIQAAVSSELRQPRYKITDLQIKNSPDDTDENTDVNPSTRRSPRKSTAAVSQP